MSDINSMLAMLRRGLEENDQLRDLWAGHENGFADRLYVISMPAGFILRSRGMVSAVTLKNATLMTENEAGALARNVRDGNLTRGTVMTIHDAIESDGQRVRNLIQVLEQARDDNTQKEPA